MPVDARFMPEAKYISFDETTEIISELCDYGLEELRLTGGEPLMRPGFTELTRRLALLPLKKIGMTTNGVFLDRHFEELQRDRIHNLNISLDTLNAETFLRITHGNHLARVLKNIRTAVDEGFHVKINVVSMRGVNDHELFDFVNFSRDLGIEVRFLEVMRIGYACKEQSNQYIPSSELLKRLKTKYSIQPQMKESDSTSFNYVLEGGAQIGFIASESKAFCGQCSRWRLSADGIMRACLLKDDGLVIKNKSKEERAVIYQSLLGMKPLMRPKEVAHIMNTIGG
jgi:cyclic pyranopterin phosphate synthase